MSLLSDDRREAMTAAARTMFSNGMSPEQVTAALVESCGDVADALVVEMMGAAGKVAVGVGETSGVLLTILAKPAGELVDTIVEQMMKPQVTALVADAYAAHQQNQADESKARRRKMLSARIREAARGRFPGREGPSVVARLPQPSTEA